MGQCSSCSEELLQSPPGLGPAAIRERDELVPHRRGSPSAEIVGSRVSERGPCWERQLSPAKVPSRRRRPARHPSLSCRARRVGAAASPARPVPTAGSGSKWRWLRPRCCPGRRLPRRYRPRRRLPWCRGPGNRRYSPSASSRRRRTPSPNGGRRGHPPRGSKGAGGCPSPMVPRARDDVTDVTLSRRTPARGGGRGSPITGGQLGTPVKAGVGTMRCQSQPAPPIRVAEGQAEARTSPRRRCIPTFSAAPGDTCSFTRHSRPVAGQHEACAITSVPPAQRPGQLPGPATGLPPSPSAAAGEWKLQPAEGGRGAVRTGRSWGSIPGHAQVLWDVHPQPSLPPRTRHVSPFPGARAHHFTPPGSRGFFWKKPSRPISALARGSITRRVGRYRSARGPAGSSRPPRPSGSWR